MEEVTGETIASLQTKNSMLGEVLGNRDKRLYEIYKAANDVINIAKTDLEVDTSTVMLRQAIHNLEKECAKGARHEGNGNE